MKNKATTTRTNLAACLDAHRYQKEKHYWRPRDERPVKELAAEVGVSTSVMQRFLRGDSISGANLTIILQWLLQLQAKNQK